MALAHYPPFLDRPLPIQSKHPYLLSVAPKQPLPMSNPYSWNKSPSGLESWDAPQTSWTIDSSYSTLQSAVQPSEPTSSHTASGAHPLQHPLPESPRCDPSLTSRLPVPELGHLSPHSPGLRGLDSMFRFPPTGSDLLYTIDDSLDVEQAALMTHKSTPVVKEEQEDGSVTAAFVFESSPSTPGPSNEGPRETQVPLRATQATKAMRKMMSVFRLNPFAVQGSAPTVDEAGPLEEEGRLFEFQLRLGDTPPPSSPPVRSASTLPESRTTSPCDDWMGRARHPSELGNRRMVETPGTTDGSASAWGYQLPAELSPPFTLPPGVVECRDPAGVDASGARMGLGSRTLQTPSPRYGPYSQGTQGPSGRGSAHNCAYGYGTVSEQGHRRYSGAQRDPSRPATPGTSFANVFEPQDPINTSTVMSGESFIATSHDPRRQRRWGGNRQHGSYS